MHDGILVGVGTALNDDPQLNSEEAKPFCNWRGTFTTRGADVQHAICLLGCRTHPQYRL